jgi:hypothetical protein
LTTATYPTESILTRAEHQLKLKASMTYSERIVNCRVSGDQWRGRTVFTLEAAAPGVDQEPDEEETDEAAPETPEPLALPADTPSA